MTTGVAQRTVVVLPERWSGILPAAAVPALRAAERVLADATVPDEVVTATGAVRADGWGDDGVAEVLLTTDPSRADGGAVVGLPEGAALLDAVAVMDRLRSPGGCPWDAEQTHESLLQYLVEECYELYQAIEDGDRDAIREELGDVLLQVLFHARVAAEHDARPFTIDDVAGDLVAKLVGRHPHVFAGSEQIDTAERQERRWEELKRAEKQRGSSVDGVPLGQPAVALAAKLTSRTARAHLPTDLLPAGASVGEQLFALAAKAKLAGVDPEAELRTAARRFADRVRAAEQAAVADGADPHALDAAGWRRYWPAAG
ncbi:XTP/dITP diphosphohydrolase [Pseudonocardia cypriaca]|uniref:XTP/dITP diphosphohydrolase n=1 Tax=Pseudonocardia cypriaca TaxID=882449 RepID=A0A543FYC5_9PSEU|nr:MazG family protein [Pseudonocardia cypriaca]TQM38843.1 XTP/dITP diphosphohydrolase [Pseudonocardia cypriaca]